MYFFVFFFSIVYLSARFQQKCTDVGLKFLCVRNRFGNGTYFHDRAEKRNLEYCVAKYSRLGMNVTLHPTILLYYSIFFIFVAFFLFVFSWYCSVYQIKRANI